MRFINLKMGRERAATRIHNTLPELFDARNTTDRATAFGFRLSNVFSQLTFGEPDRIPPAHCERLLRLYHAMNNSVDNLVENCLQICEQLAWLLLRRRFQGSNGIGKRDQTLRFVNMQPFDELAID